jgi:hypothetical protein
MKIFLDEPRRGENRIKKLQYEPKTKKVQKISVLHTELFVTGAHNREYYARVLWEF